MRKILWIVTVLWVCGLIAAARADTYPLTDGTSVTGDVISYNDDGVIFRESEDKYTDRIPWTKFSQEALKALAKNPKLTDYATPFIETPPPVPVQAQVNIHPVSRVELPPKQSVIGALFSSALGIIVILIVYAGNIYAGVEVAIFRAQPIALVAGVSAALPIVGPIIFLSMPTKVAPGADQQDMQMATGAPPEAAGAGAAAPAAHTPEAGGQPAEPTAEGAHAGGLHLASAPAQPAAALPPTQSYQRGQFTFNRRFFETKFSSFFGVARHGADKDMVLLVKTGRNQHVVERISRIAANEIHFEVAVGAGRQEVMVAFGEIQEIQLKHKDA